MVGAIIARSSDARAASPTRLVAAVQFACIVALWIATRPYFGVIHDSRLYAIQALNSLEPGRFSQDLYFKFGSQDSFSTFTLIYRYLVAAAGVGPANLIGTVIGEACWLAAALYLMRTLFRGRLEWMFALVAVIALDAKYGPFDIFVYGEPFTTPRLYAEALVMAAMSLALRGRFLGCGALLAFAAALHPLMAAVGVGLLVFLAALRDRRVWILVGLGAVACALLVWLGVGPFGRALVTFDDAWFAQVRERSRFAVMGGWHWWDLCEAGAVLSLLATACGVATSAERKLILALLAVTVAGVLANFIGGDIARNVLIVDLQTWRVLWFATLIANACVAVIVLRSPKDWTSRELLLMAGVVSAATHFTNAASVVGPVLTMSACAVFAIERLRGRALPSLARVLVKAGYGLGLVLLAALAYRISQHDHHLIFVIMLACVAVAAVALLAVSIRRGATVILAVASGAVLVASVAFADRIAPWDAYAVSPPADDGLSRFVAGAGNIYWEGGNGLQLLWFKLHRPGYYSCLQGTGGMFYRGTALDYTRRERALRALDTRDFEDDADSYCGVKVHPGVKGPTSPAQLANACRALPDLDTMILNRPVPGLPARVWRSPVAQEYVEKDGRMTLVSTFYRYNCAALR